ncbi:MAG: response regulator, partial [Proteobacteria bacterium]|nr:response regulator [Pseudomonadota bacterium]
VPTYIATRWCIQGALRMVGSRDKIEARNARQRALASLTEQALGQTKMKGLLRSGVDLCCGALELDYGVVLEYRLEGTAQIRVFSGFSAESARQAVFSQSARELVGVTLVREVLVIEDFGAERDFPCPEMMRNGNVKSGILALIGQSKRPFGVIGVFSGSHRTFSPEDQELVRSVANILGTTFQRILANEQLQRRDRQLREAQKLEAVGRLAGGIAHDFNNHLTAMMSYCEFLQMELDANHPLWEDVASIARTTRSAAKLTNELLAFSRQQLLQPVVLDFNEVISGVGGMLRRMVGEKIKLVQHFEQPVLPVFADPIQLERVLVNLIINAREALPDGGKIEVFSEVIELGKHNEYSLSPGEYACVKVSDDGVGMTEDVRARIFDPFFSTRGHGVGLGLSTALGVLKQSKGDLFAETRLGEGSTFTVLLPLSPGVPDEESSSVVIGLFQGVETVLFVDDNPAICAIGGRVLEQHGYRVFTAESGAEALDVFGANKDSIEMVVTDIMMPDFKGPEVVHRIKQMSDKVRFLYITAFADEAVANEISRTSEISILQKPFTPTQLAQVVRDVMDGVSVGSRDLSLVRRQSTPT